MSENARLNGCLDEIELGFVEREATPKSLMKLGVRLHLAGLSLSNTVFILEIFGVERARSTVHNWVHKADLQPEASRCPDHVAVDETVIQLNDERYWLYAAVDPETNEFSIKARTDDKEGSRSFISDGTLRETRRSQERSSCAAHQKRIAFLRTLTTPCFSSTVRTR